MQMVFKKMSIFCYATLKPVFPGGGDGRLTDRNGNWCDDVFKRLWQISM